MASRAFGSKHPRHAHLIAGGGLNAEIRDLRADVEQAFVSVETDIAALNPYVQRIGVIPTQIVDADGIVASGVATTAAGGAVTLTGAEFNGILAPGTGGAVIKTPKLVTFTVGGTTADFADGDVVFVGTDADGLALTETVVTAFAGAGGTITTTEYFATLTTITFPEGTGTGGAITAGVAADAACIANGASAATAQDITLAASFNTARVGNRLMSHARALTLTVSSHANWDASAAVISGLDINGDAISETFTIPNNGNSAIQGVKYFAQVLRIQIAAQSGVAGTWTLGFLGTTVGLAYPILDGAIAATVLKELERDDSADTSWAASVAGTVTIPASALPNGCYTPNSAPNGCREHLLCYITA